MTSSVRRAGPAFLAVLFLAFAIAGVHAASSADLPAYAPDANAPRASIPAAYQWDLSPLFASENAYEAARAKLLGDIAGLKAFEGKLADPGALADCLELYFRLHRDANFLTLYADLRQSTAETDDAAMSMGQRSRAAMDELTGAASFIRREVLALPTGAVESAFARTPRLAPYRAYVRDLVRRGKHVLSPDGERALRLLGDNLWAEIDLNELPSPLEEAHSALLADIPWPKIKDESGKEVQLTLSNYNRFRASANRDVRRQAVGGLFDTLRTYQHALAATMAGQAKLSVGLARARGYETALAAYLDKEEVTEAVYDNLLRTVSASTPLLHRYIELRKKALGLSEIHLYDLYVPLVPGVEKSVPFADARTTLQEALRPLGVEYGKILAEGLDPRHGWIDLYPHRDKESGAFSASVYGPHPWVFMNYQNSLDDMSTLAHEYGHALHSYLSMRAQPYPDFRYTTLLAEVASTCNEALLSDHLVARTNDRATRLYLLVDRLESIRTTIFRQTMFADFERTVHELAEAGTPITASLLEQKYRELVRRYYGPGLTIDPNDGMEWAYIPHLYYKYYVYSYATGLSSGIAIADRIRERGEPAVQAYLGMLRAGCSAPPIELLKKAGVDLTTPAPIEAAMRTFQRTLAEVEQLLAR